MPTLGLKGLESCTGHGSAFADSQIIWIGPDGIVYKEEYEGRERFGIFNQLAYHISLGFIKCF